MKYCDRCMTAYPDDFKVCPRDQTPLRPSAELVPGTVLLGKYRILNKIGAGGMAVVYKAQHMAFDEVRAIKVVNAHLLEDPEFVRRFRTEAIITRKLHHPNAVRVDDLESTEDGRPFIVMEYVDGQNLRDLVHGLKVLPLGRAVGIARQVAAALGAAHKLGIVHRDIKPDNILLLAQPDGGETVKVMDFGIATMRQGSVAAGGHTPTQSGVIVGTPQYLSPEQAAGKREIDGRADLYSLGVVLYEMVTGQLPFAASEDPSAFLAHHLQTPPTPPEEAAPEQEIPRGLSALILKALEKDPAERYQTAEEMLEALEAQGHWGASAAGFRLGKEIESNATSTVYEAVDARTERPTVVRLVKLHGRLLERDTMLSALQKSAEAARGLNSPNIASLLGAGEKDGQFYIVNERVEGVLLRTTLQRAAALPLSEVLDVARQVCMAFAHAHARQVMHGNLHPGNIITEWDGSVKILDYGIAVFPDDAHAGAERLRYTAPEHAGGDPADVRADLFSLGTVLYEMLTGSKAFPGQDATEVMDQLVNLTPRPAHEVYSAVPEGLSMVLEKALAKNPEERYQNAAVLLRDIENYDSLVTQKTGAMRAASPARTAVPARPTAAPPAAAPAKATTPAPAANFPRPPTTPRPAIQVKPQAVKAPPPAPRPQPVVVARSSSKANLIVGAIGVVVLAALIVAGVMITRRGPQAPPTETTTQAPAAATRPAQPSTGKPAPRPRAGGAQPAPTESAPAASTTGDLELATIPAGASIKLDGNDVADTTPATLRALPGGAHTVAFTLEGYHPASRAFSIKPGETFHLAVPLTPAGAAVSITSDPPGAAILIDGKATGKTTPASFVGEPGSHGITLRKEGYLDATTTAKFIAGQPYRYSTPLLAAGNAASIRSKGLFGGRPATMGGLKIETRPKGAQITINGKVLEKKTPVELNLDPGNYQVTVALPGYKPATRVVNIAQGSTSRFDATLEKQ